MFIKNFHNVNQHIIMDTLLYNETNAKPLITALITRFIDTDAIWYFSVDSRKHEISQSFPNQVKLSNSRIHFYLLVFAPNVELDKIGVITDKVFKKSEGQLSVTMIVYDTHTLSKIKGNHRAFLHGVITNTECQFKKPNYVLPNNLEAPIDTTAKEKYWSHCKYMAVSYLEAELAIENPNGESVQVVLIHEAVEQICLGLIYVFTGCRPNYYKLDYLIDLCGLFFQEIKTIFPRNSEEEKARFSLLSRDTSSLRYRISSPSITDIEVLRARVNMLLQSSIKAVQINIF